MKPRLNVVGAAIIKEGKVLALRRSHGNESIIHKFEFVGGKIEEGETPEEALASECMEELSLENEVGVLL
ncbi:MAG: NUDIX domain-containing protein, partial [Clostridia bacterium]|nr:NUDIX domain-containing protein [Clostridia bacterium]